VNILGHLTLMLAGSLAVLSACNQGGTVEHVAGSAPKGADAVGSSSAGLKSAGMSAMPGNGKVDVVVVVAMKSASAQLPAKITGAITDFVHDLATDVGAGLKISLVATGAAAILKSPDAALAAGNGKGIDLQLSGGNALLGALAAGCETKKSLLQDPKGAKSPPSLCGESLLSVEGNTAETLGQTQFTDVTSLRGSLVGFLRPGTARAYVVITDDDAQFMDGEVLAKIVKAQNGGMAAAVYALAPDKDGANGDCPASSKAVKTYGDVTHDTGGALYSYCDADLSNSVHAIVASIVKLK
jgi:hypothetical protein